MRGRKNWGAFLGVLVSLIVPAVAAAQKVPRITSVREREFRHPDLYVPETNETLQQLPAPLASQLQGTLSKFGVSSESIFFDSRTARANSLILHQPLIPGTGKGNSLSWASGKPQNDSDLSQHAWTALQGYLNAHKNDLRIDPNEFEPTPRVGIFDDGNLIFIHVQRMVNGIPVRDNSIGAAINHGNLVLLGLQKWADVDALTSPSVSLQAAQDAVAAYLRPLPITRYIKQPTLEIIPMAGTTTITYRLAWVVTAKVGDDSGTWEALVDAANGTLFAFQDTNQYGGPTGVISGGVYPISNDQRPPDGIEQPNWPMSFADFTQGGVKQFTDVGGNVGCIPGSISTALSGLYLKIVDDCGAINETGTGGIDLGFGPTATATDCTTPTGHSAGDTKSARTGFYELNRQIEKAQSHLGPGTPAGVWLRQQVTAEMNENNVCNAFWDGVQVNFFRSAVADGCANTGEIAAIFDHEWGHGVDNNGVDPSIASPGEAIADMYAMLRLHVSCIGRGFFTTAVCDGYGDACTGTPADGCTGVRDIDFDNHRCDEPHTITWIQNGFSNAQCGGTGSATACPIGSQNGPCGHEVHCEGMVMAETGWDLMTRDLTAPPFNYDTQRAHEVAARLIYLGAQPVSSWYTCSVGGGCSATGGYLSLLAVDDDNGDITDGTPHMTAIRAAFQRHEIHCATPAPVNSGCDGAPTDKPVVTLTPGDRSVNVSWTAVDGASSYLVYRGDGIDGCNFGRPIIANTSDLSFLDDGLANGRLYSYSVVPVGTSAACMGPMSVCVQGTPAAGPDLSFVGSNNVSGGDGDPFLDNCELATISFSVDNIGNTALTNLRITNITAVTHPLSTIVTTLPSPIAATLATCSVADSSFQVIAQGLTFGGESDFLIEVTADEFAGGTRSQLVKLFHTESDLSLVPSVTYSFEDGRDGWTTTNGTFNRILGSGANGTSAHMQSSSSTNGACDIVQSPLLVLTDTSTLAMFVRYDIEPHSDAWYDRANVSVVNSLTGNRTVVDPSSGRAYDVPDGSPNGTCQTSGQGGYAGQSPGYPSSYFASNWTSAALNPGSALTGVPVNLQINYGTDSSLAGAGFSFDEVTLNNVYLLVPDSHSDNCALAVAVGPAALAVDTAGNGVLEPGEVAVVSPSWSNTGLNLVALNGGVSNFTGPAGPTYDITDAVGAYPSANPGDTVECSDCYGVQITAAARPSVHWDATLQEDVNPASLVAGGSLSTKTWTVHVGNSFTDVPSSSIFYPSIENVLHNGVTAGCGAGTTFCPTDTVTRQQMAVFLLKAAEGSAYVPPACTTPVFSDVPCSSPFAPWIDDLASRGITAGCGDGSTFCPTDPTNRQQMAVFLLKMKEGSSYAPPVCTTASFGDVPCSSPFAPWVYDLVARGVTAGCGGGEYCPTEGVARQQMAVFVVKVFDLLLYGP
jgi:trimeric autotransporter adhesin